MIDADRVREATDEVLSRPGYRELAESPFGRLLSEIRSWFAERLFDLFGGAAAANVGVIVAIAVVGIVVVVGVIALLGVQRRRVGDVIVPTQTAATVAEALIDADAARAAADFTTAVRERYGALVLLLREHEVLPARPGTTVGEIDAVVAAAVPRCATQVAAAGAALADVVYGHRPATQRDDDTVAVAVRDLSATLPTHAALS